MLYASILNPSQMRVKQFDEGGCIPHLGGIRPESQKLGGSDEARRQIFTIFSALLYNIDTRIDSITKGIRT